MKPVVTCVYDMVRSHPGVLSTEVYAIGHAEYIVEFKFRGKAGVMLTGDFGVYDGIGSDGNYAYTNESPSGQPDDNGSEELGFLGWTMLDSLVSKCHVFPTIMDTVRFPGTPPDPPRQQVDMGGRAK